jgi:hypothetical protein
MSAAMKLTLLLLIGLLAAQISLAESPSDLLLAKISGTVSVQEIKGTNATVHTTALNNNRLFDEFGVSSEQYELVADIISSEHFVALVPRSASAELPIIPVITIADARTIAITKTQSVLFEVPMTNSTPTTNIFKSFRGTASGSAKINGSTFMKMSLNGVGSSRNPDVHLFKFKVTTSKPFTPEP